MRSILRRPVPAKMLVSCMPMLLCAAASCSQTFSLKDGATVVWYGDSITAQRLYTRFAEDFILTRYPQLHLRFFNAGVPGDTVFGGYAGTAAQRVQRDVQPFHPAMITVLLGMNDGAYGYTPEAKVHQNFIQGYGDLLSELHGAAPEAALTLLNPTPYDEITHGTEFPGYAAIMQRISGDVTALAAHSRTEDGPPMTRADLQTPVLLALTLAKARFPELAPLLIPDRVHPADSVHWMMAAELMKAWHVDPTVSSVTLNAKTGRVQEAQRTVVTGLTTLAAQLKWTQQDDALPLPLDLNNAMTAVMLAVSGVAQLDQEMLRVDGLEGGRYDLTIDTKTVATFSSDELHGGINLALLKTPMWEQARGIDFLEERRGLLEHAHFVLAEELKQTDSSAAADRRLREAEDELDATIRSRLTLKPHAFALCRRSAQ